MAIVAIQLYDAQATPVNHVFNPTRPDQIAALWFEDTSQASPIGYWRISVELKRPAVAVAGQSSKDRVYRVKVTMHEPVLETLGTSDSGLTPAPTLAYVSRGFAEFVLPERGTLQNRKDLRKMLHNLLNEAQTIAAIETLVMPF